MNSRFVSQIATLGLLLLQGCAYQAQTANLAPSLEFPDSTEGKNVSVAVRIIDERPSKSLGHRAHAYGPAGEITATQELASVLDRQIKNGLRKKGFTLVDYSATADPKLTIEIRLFEYTMSQGFTFGLHVKGALKAFASLSKDNYENFYRTEVEERVFTAPTAATNESVINAGLTKLLNEMFRDSKLFNFLAGKRSNSNGPG